MFARLRNRRSTLLATALFFVAAATAPDLKSQTTTGVILGTVLDSSGAVIPGAAIQITNEETGNTQTTVTDEQGRYNVPALQVGTYDVQASLPGFQTMIKKKITLTVGGQSVVDFNLQVGQAQEAVTVEADIVQVETTTSDIGTLISQVQMAELPLNGRNFEQLITLGIGVQNISTNNHGSFYGNGNTYSVAGSRPEGAVEMLDDTSLNTFWNHGSGAVSLGTAMGVEAISEFKTLVNTYSAQFGGNGAVINAATKSGTNDFHGSMLEFLRNDALDARNFNDGPKKPELRKNQFGGSIGGPLKKNKLFFFADYEGLRQVIGSTQAAFVPDAAARRGYVPNAAGTAYVPFSGARIGTGSCTAAYTESSNCITNPLVQQIANIYPTSTEGGLAFGGIVRIPQVANTTGREDYGVVRIDYNIREKDSLFGRYIIDWANRNSPFNPQATAIPYWPEEDFSRNQYFVFEERHVFSPTLINLVRASFSRPNQYAIPGASPANAPASVSSIDFFPERLAGQIQVTGLSRIGQDNSHLPYNLGLNRFSWADDVLWTRGAHSLRFGAQLDRVQYNDQGPFNLGGVYSFNSLSNFLAGTPATYNATVQGVRDAFRYVRATEFFPYVQDEWRATRKLTLNLGLRYEIMNNPSCRPCTLLGPNGDVTQAVPAPPDFGYSSVNRVFAKNPTLGNYAPRVGFAYDPFGDHRLAIRAGFGMFYDLIEARTYMPGLWAAPPSNAIQFQNPSSFPVPNSSVTSSALVASPAVVGQQPISNPGNPVWSNTKTPHMMQWNLNVQRELWDHTVLSLGYVGSAGINLIDAINANPSVANANGQYSTLDSAGRVVLNNRLNSRIIPGSNVTAYGTMTQDLVSGHSSYNSLQTSVNHPLNHDVQMQFNYTFSKCMDANSVTAGQELRSANPSGTNPYNQRLNRGRCGFDVTHTVRLNGLIQLPFDGNRLISGWRLTPIFAYSTGSPFDVTEGITNWDGVGVNRPSIIPGCDPMAGARTAQQWFNPKCFTLQPVGTLGNFGRNVLNIPGTVNLDLGISKDTTINERFKLQYRAEFFNILNHTNFGAPSATSNFSLNSSCVAGGGAPASCVSIPTTQGVITDPNPGALARQIQFGLKLVF
jgi:outer membrane receptor protein involved in Fe transport